tara:strand:- start:326 stop:730 length:405 start_codon:yes stop_codon:yes gene_type:complete
MLNSAKKQFLKSLAPGVSTVLVCSCAIDDIAASPDCIEEILIKDHLISMEENMAGVRRPWLNEDLFVNFIDNASDAEILSIMQYLEERDFGLKLIYQESCMSNDDPYDDSLKLGRLVKSGLIKNMADFVGTNLI